MLKRDIETSDDIKTVVDSFYERVKDDHLLKGVFEHVNWTTHLPVMYSFWGSMLLGDGTYRGNPLQKHLPLNINHQHFLRWLMIWTNTIDEKFEGAIAEVAKMRGRAIADVFQIKMGIAKGVRSL